MTAPKRNDHDSYTDLYGEEDVYVPPRERKSTRRPKPDDDTEPVYGAPQAPPKPPRKWLFLEDMRVFSRKIYDIVRTWYQNMKMLLRIAVIGTLGGFLWLYVKYDQDYGLAWGRVMEFWVDDAPVWLSGVWETVRGFVTGLM